MVCSTELRLAASILGMCRGRWHQRLQGLAEKQCCPSPRALPVTLQLCTKKGRGGMGERDQKPLLRALILPLNTHRRLNEAWGPSSWEGRKGRDTSTCSSQHLQSLLCASVWTQMVPHNKDKASEDVGTVQVQVGQI